MTSNRVVEKYYTPQELSVLVGFGEKFWREKAKAGEFTVKVDDAVIAEPAQLSGDILIPASGVNAYLARNPLRYDAGVKARNHAELRRKVEKPRAEFL